MATTATNPAPVAPTTALPPGPVIFFDGDCGLCSRFVRFFVAIDRRGVFRLAPLQGETAALCGVTPTGSIERWSVVLWDAGQTWEHSTAVLRSVGRLGGVWRLAGLLRLVPRPIRDGIYRFVARNRRRWFGTDDVCQMPSEKLRSRLLA
ncbi:MAG: DCC1-like thiol-disulfide oxidoreductase family protein [Planctomycetota bacterium]